MAEFPALPLFTDAYLADTRHLTVEEHGAYLILLMCAWRTRGCKLRDNDSQLCRLVGVTPRRWQRLKPVLVDFFQVENGFWTQKKLTHIYGTVARKVENNRLNGAKGGQARAEKLARQSPAKPLKEKAAGLANGKPPLCNGASACAGDQQATKAKTRTKTKVAVSAQAVPVTPQAMDAIPFQHDRVAIAAAAGLDEQKLDLAVLGYWNGAGVCAVRDIVPAVMRVRARELARGNPPPAHLAYYRDVVVEARDTRLGADARGKGHAASHPARPALRVFDSKNVADWRVLLGDRQSKFRGDYMSSNWLIPADHPVFLPANLGPDPKHRFNRRIPPEIYAEYGPLWGWQSEN
ncbi:YdaU family protein [Kordiimonas pumila]|uniref:YdaU family protein n=1 Tax=Kordiimonas pumila TaxID=2161677 RepID=A0ABV7D4J8_9PROT|nr:DUF1376 domain-containing protein [Kordiimonas pumila]